MAHQALPNLLLTLKEGCQGDARLAVEELCCEDELFLPLWEESYVMTLPVEHPMAQCSQEQRWTPIDDWITCPQHVSHQRLMALYGHSPGVVGRACRLIEAGVEYGQRRYRGGDAAAIVSEWT